MTVFIIFPRSIDGSVIADGFTVQSNIKTRIAHDAITFHRYTDTVLATETIWSARTVMQSTLPFLHKQNIDTQGVYFSEGI